jgi:D-alanyl-D-alanine carboxypeptidase/D-alanyl-D-alanine-endopeptidase (penicillin-binding protein 4)
VDGTLAERMKGTTAAANARAKTGSFSNARALAGYVRSAGGETIAFAIVANNYGVAPDVVDRTTDEIVVALSAFAR